MDEGKRLEVWIGDPTTKDIARKPNAHFKFSSKYRVEHWASKPDILCPWAPVWSTWVPNVVQMDAHGHKMSIEHEWNWMMANANLPLIGTHMKGVLM